MALIAALLTLASGASAAPVVSATIPVGDYPESVVLAFGSVCAANAGSSTVTGIKP